MPLHTLIQATSWRRSSGQQSRFWWINPSQSGGEGRGSSLQTPIQSSGLQICEPLR
ncbi:unnamed protein product [Nyctereutes procyonoides]|uniref:(raccoon dog) hypothetical protein n=1 Tax=Nyctereutes procyonoides TaxID=34880 RepID=A0A811ZM22_NYCPR|nr:unnamed protein product [Nyctereutes procyonoides]